MFRLTLGFHVALTVPVRADPIKTVWYWPGAKTAMLTGTVHEVGVIVVVLSAALLVGTVLAAAKLLMVVAQMSATNEKTLSFTKKYISRTA